MAEETDLFAGVNMATDPANMSDLEKKHTPVITAPDEVKAGECFEVTVEVGTLLAHPNERDHFFAFIDLYAGELYLARVDLTAVTTCPIMKTCVQLEKDVGPLRAFAMCNIHGTWEGRKEVRVTG